MQERKPSSPIAPAGGLAERVLGVAAGPIALVAEGDRYLIVDPTQRGGVGKSGKRPQDSLREKGQRDSGVVSYLPSHWLDERDRDAKGFAKNVDLFLQLAVHRAEGVDPDGRRAGVTYRFFDCDPLQVQEGTFCRRLGDGSSEEWHVRLPLKGDSPGIVAFYVWYDDGRGKNYFDDNQGELYLVQWRAVEAIRHDFRDTVVEMTERGVHGTLAVVLADLGFNKEVELVWTTDGWKTTGRFGSGKSTTNKWHWVKDSWTGYQQWQIQLDIPGDADEFEYAIVYRHGIASGATVYEFWADNGKSNYMIRKYQRPRL